MPNDTEFKVELRALKGKGASRRLRNLEDKVPGIVYGAGEDPQQISISHKILSRALENEATYSRILTLNIDNQDQLAVLKSVQRHPAKPQILHVDFQRVKMKEKITMSVPIHYHGEENAVGVKKGGVVSHIITSIEIQCLPANLPEYLEVDISALDIGHALHISDLPLPKGVELTIAELDEEHNQPIISIHMPRVVEEETLEETAPETLEAEGQTETSTEE